VKRDRKLAKLWLAPVRMAYNYGFSDTELNRIADIARKHEAELSKAWHDYFKRSDDNDGGSERSRNRSHRKPRFARELGSADPVHATNWSWSVGQRIQGRAAPEP